MSTKLTQAQLKEVLQYDPETGAFTWRSGHGKVRAHERAGSRHAAGYRQINLGGAVMLEHRLAHLYMRGCWPRSEVDHRNGVRSDNRWDNLRPATSSEQKQNATIRKDNTSGFQGVGWFKPKGKWRARIRVGGREHHLGYFDDPESAYAARCAAKLQLHPFQPTARPT